MLPRLLRRAGVQVSAQRARSYLQAIAEIGLDHADDVRDASRASLVSRQTDLAPFDVTFDLFWSLLRGASLPTVVPGPRSPDAKADQIEVPLGQVPARMTPLVQRAVRVVASPVELLAMAGLLLLKRVGRRLRLRLLGRCRGRHRVLQTAVRAGADPDNQDQADNDPDDIGDNVEKRIEAERYFARATAAADHSSGQWSVVSG